MDLPELRPLSLGELLDRTFTYYRRHFWLFVGIMAVPQVMIVAVNVLSQSLNGPLMPRPGTPASTTLAVGMFAGFAIGTIVMFLAYFVLYALALGATTFAVSDVHLGRATTARAAYRTMRGRFWRLVDLIFTVMIRMFLVFMLIVIVAMLGAVAIPAVGGPAGALVGGLLMLLALLGGMVFAVWLFLRYGVAVPALLLENLKAREAIKPSVVLTRNNLARVLLITFLMSMVAGTVASICQGPFFVALIVMTIKGHGAPPLWLTVPMNIAGGVGQALTGPLLMIGLVLLYYDIRVRKEGFDLQLMMSALDSRQVAPPRAGTDAMPAV